MVDTLLRLINVIVTVSLFPQLYRIYSNTNRRFYLYWSIGFLAYSGSIFLRLFEPSIEGSLVGIVAYCFNLVGILLIITGVSGLIRKPETLVLSILTLPLILLIINSFVGNWIQAVRFFSILPNLIVVLILFILSWRFKAKIDLVLVGWVNILLLNIAFVFNLMESSYIDLMAIFSKILIYIGVINHSFIYQLEDIRPFLIRSSTNQYSEGIQGKISLINLQNSYREKELEWIKERTNINSKKGIYTIIVSMYDLITQHDVFNSENAENLYFIRMIPGKKIRNITFNEHVTLVKDDVNQLDILIRDTLNFSDKSSNPCEIILYSLSFLIHTHGWKRIYTLITSKTPSLKSSQVSLTFIYFHDAHENKKEITIFEKIADKLVD